MRDAAVPGRTGSLRPVAAQRPGFGIVDLHVELRIVFERHAGFCIETLRPVQIVDVLHASDEFAARAIERVIETIAGEMPDDLAAAAADRRVVQHVDADLVVVPRVIRRVLEVPRQLAVFDVQRNDRVRIEIVARPRLRVVLGNRIAGSPDRQLARRIIRAGLPEAASAGLPRVVLVLPGFAAGLARFRDGIPAPELVACSGVERRNPATRLPVTRAVCDYDLAVGGDGRRKESFATAELVGARDLLVPDDLARAAVDANDAAIGQVGDDEIFPERDAARPRHVALMLDTGIGDPDELASVRLAHVDLVERPPAVGGIHHAVVDERVYLVLGAVLPDILHSAERQRPDQPEVLDVVPIDLRQLRISGRPVVAVHHQPVLRLVQGVDQPVSVHGHGVLGGDDSRGRCDPQTDESEPCELPRSMWHGDLLGGRLAIMLAVRSLVKSKAHRSRPKTTSPRSRRGCISAVANWEGQRCATRVRISSRPLTPWPSASWPGPPRRRAPAGLASPGAALGPSR